MKHLDYTEMPYLIERIRNSDIVLADSNGKQILVYGRAAAERIRDSGQAADLCVVIIPIDINTNDLEMLIAAVTHVHGFHDYVAGVN